MSDLVKRLRGAYSTVFERSLAREAATRIERLEAFVEKMRAVEQTWGANARANAIVEALRELEATDQPACKSAEPSPPQQ